MFGLGKPTPIAEWAAEGRMEQTYHEIRQTLRVTGVNLNFRTWATFGEFLPEMWEAFRANAGTRGFDEAANRLRAEAASAASGFGPPAIRKQVTLGESQAYQIGAALDLYHHVNPKLLLLTAAVRCILDGETIVGTGTGTERLLGGAPLRMAPMEMESDDPDDQQVKKIFDDIKETLQLPSINSDYRTLALWPDYLAAAWNRLKPLTQQPGYRSAADALRETARSLARQLPHRFTLDRARLEKDGVDVSEVAATTARFEQLLPGLILNIAWLEHDWRETEALTRPPFPATTAKSRGGKA